MIDGETIRDNHQLINDTIDKINTQMEKDHPMMFKEVMTEIKAEFEPKFKQLGVDYDSQFDYDNNISSLQTLDLLDMDQEIINYLNIYDEFFDIDVEKFIISIKIINYLNIYDEFFDIDVEK